MRDFCSCFRDIILPVILLLLLTGFVNDGYGQKVKIEAEGDLIWADEFDGSGEPDATKWERQEYNRRNNENGPDGWWSKEDSYLDGNGNLVIRVRQIENKNEDTDSCDFSVGALRTKGRFEQLYGRFEIRCQLPTQPGWWVAFWMMQGDVGAVGNEGVDGTEVDIMEGFGWTNFINYAFHWDGYGEDHKSTGKKLSPAGIREGFHTFAMEWYPEMYVFYIDGEETWRSKGGGVCNQPGYIKVTGEISTEPWAINNYWANHPAAATYPDSFLVDYVRVYELGEYQYPARIKSRTSSGNYDIFPNPVNKQFRVKWDPLLHEGLPSVSIMNIAGQMVKSFGPIENNSNLFVDDLTAGLYCLSIHHDDAVECRKFFKE
ncbi:MAG: family 16 glycosylhydrolase [Bacteroidales bacterium]